jgi:hypothetical protein
MICVITAPIDLANYIDVYNLKQRFPGERVCHLSWADLSGMQGQETLYLLGHGEPGSIEGKDAPTLAAELVKRGLTRPIRRIKLLVCASGVYTTADGGKIVPFCQKLADALRQAGGPATVVVGFDGATANTMSDGRTYAKNVPQPQFPNWNEFLQRHGQLYQQLDGEAEKLAYDSEQQIVQNAKRLQGRSVDLFEWLYTNNKLYTLPSSHGKTYGVPGQQIDGRPPLP